MRKGTIAICFQTAFALTLATERPLPAQQPAAIEGTNLAGSPHLALFADAKIDAFDYLEAALSIEDKGAKVTWAPFMPRESYDFWSETRLQLGQKEKNTIVGLSVQYNPLHPRSTRGNALWKPKSDDPFGLLIAKDLVVVRLEKEIEEELVAGATGCLPLPRDPNPDMVWPDPTGSPPAEAALNSFKCAILDVNNRISTVEGQIFPLAAGDPGLAPLQKQLVSLNKAKAAMIALVERSYLAQQPPSKVAALLDQRTRASLLRAETKAAREAFAAAYYLQYRVALLATRKPVVNLSLVETLFPILDGSSVDSDSDGLKDNANRTKSTFLTLTSAWRLGERNSLALLLSRSKERASAEMSSKTANYNGFGLTWSRVVKVLNEDGYQKSADFKESLFVPMIAVGLAYERKECDAPDLNCVDAILQTQALTPFVDVKLSKVAQFRLGLPLTRSDKFDEEEVDSISVVTLFALQLGAPK